LRRRILLVHPEESWPLRHRPRHRTRSVIRANYWSCSACGASFTKIDAFEPLPDLGQQFDWITAFSTNFYLYHPAKKRWGTANGISFCAITASPGAGRKNFFGLNPSYNGGFYTPEIRDLFLSRGADVERERIFFHNGLRF